MIFLAERIRLLVLFSYHCSASSDAFFKETPSHNVGSNTTTICFYYSKKQDKCLYDYRSFLLQNMKQFHMKLWGNDMRKG